MIEDYSRNIVRFEELLQKITASTTTGIVLERLPPSDLWKRCQNDVVSLQSLAGQLKDSMLLLRPERAPTIERRTGALLQPLSNFKDVLFQTSDDPMANSRLALDELRKAVMESSNLLDLGKEIRDGPSEAILAILKLKEVYDAKEYLSAIPVPEAAYIRFVGLKRDIEQLRLSVASLETSLGELRRNLDSVAEEISKFRPLSAEKAEEKPRPETIVKEEAGSEPTLVSEDRG